MVFLQRFLVLQVIDKENNGDEYIALLGGNYWSFDTTKELQVCINLIKFLN